ncbi:M23 family metallopeptidase [Actinomyces culturomici]|uniref:M23 family metallopeptidase n=1 Tax=Actinomyces culturomici TaxID=1926276 RepID=UPI000E207DDA|nr:M23 family metallopeptidase [Actinomyces culturomici]
MRPPEPSRVRRRTGLVPAFLLTLVLLLAPGTAVADEAGAAPWSWPAESPVRVVRAFDPPARPWLPGHRGVDLDLPVGRVVRAPADGRVSVAGELAGRGVVAIAHGRIRSTFEPVIPLVAVGEEVARGQAVAVVAPGHSPGALHWGAKVGADVYVDPLRLLVPEVVLKPWDG